MDILTDRHIDILTDGHIRIYQYIPDITDRISRHIQYTEIYYIYPTSGYQDRRQADTRTSEQTQGKPEISWDTGTLGIAESPRCISLSLCNRRDWSVL